MSLFQVITKQSPDAGLFERIGNALYFAMVIFTALVTIGIVVGIGGMLLILKYFNIIIPTWEIFGELSLLTLLMGYVTMRILAWINACIRE
jgi:hypothetical protein